MRVQFKVNGKSAALEVPPNTLLVQVLREQLKLTGTHVGCDTAQCGACTVIMDGRSIKSCNVLAAQADGSEITTIEGLAAADGTMHPMQAAFVKHDGYQCGYCTPGFVMSLFVGLHEGALDDHAIAGNLCRCTGYQNIIKAVQYAAKKLQEPVAA